MWLVAVTLAASLLDGAVGLQVTELNPKSISFQHTNVEVLGGGFVEFQSYSVEFAGTAVTKVFSCTGSSTTVITCDLTSGPGAFTSGQNGYYRITVDGSNVVPALFYVHDETYAISDFRSLDGVLTSTDTYNVVGNRQVALVLSGDGYGSDVAVARFTSVGLIDGEVFTTDVLGVTQTNDAGELFVLINTPAWKTPIDWQSSCGDPVVPGGSCAPDLAATISISLDGTFFSTATAAITFGFVSPQLLAFLYPGPTDDFGFTFQINAGRVQVEFDFGGKVDASNVTESVTEGEFAFGQPNFGNTSLTNTPVERTLADGEANDYFQAFQLMKEFCARNFSVVFTCSFGFQKQTLDASFLPECLGSGTKFVNIGGLSTTPTASTGFAKIYQMRYLTGLIAGADLAQRKFDFEQINGNNSYARACVGYIAAFPIPEIQRGINAFVIGCKKNFPDCVVKVLWTGTFTDALLEEDAAAFLFNVGQCDVITQHSDSIEPQLYYAERGGSGIGYNTDARSLAGDTVLTSSLFAWEVVFQHFIINAANDAWVPGEAFFPGTAEGAVELALFSPKVDPAVRQQVEAEKARLDAASGDAAFREIFCGPLKAKFVYKQQNGNGSVIANLGNAEWVELDTAVQINPTHYITIADAFLGPNDIPTTTDCLWGTSLSFPGEALTADAYPSPFDPSRVFSNYLLEGVELFDPIVTDFGTIVGVEAVFSPEGYPSGDRFFERPVEYPLCDGSQWLRLRAACDASTLATPIVYSFIQDANNDSVLCGTEVNNLTRKISTIATLPFIASSDPLAPSCDFLLLESVLGMLNLAVIVVGVVFLVGIYVMYNLYRKERTVINTQPRLVRYMTISGVLLCASFALFLGEPRDEICVAQIWVMNITFDFMFAILWAKVYRIYAIFKYTRKFRRLNLRTMDLILMAIYITLLDVAILTVWTLLDPPRVRATDLNLNIDDGLGSIDRLECNSESPAFLYVMFFYKALLIFSNCVLVYLQRDVPEQLEQLIPYRYILISAYNTALFLGIVVFLANVVDDVVTKHTIYTIGGVVGTMVLIGALAYPPIATAMRKKEFLSNSGYQNRMRVQERPVEQSESISREGSGRKNTQGHFMVTQTEEDIMIHKI